YKPGKHGIRTENDLLIIEVATNEFGTFLAFETLSFCPIDTAAIDKALLTDIEVDFLNGYHAEVFEKLSPLLTQEERDWLAKATEKI
ncbi:MAG: M24 family metallopeptidase C-terminal domain-containing protein, partial [Defluviitaleaceae bacterium]|nr:M24 family metallopeptidase C-terminal domain-containing protein [Defluviitaleaceae bacterium]